MPSVSVQNTGIQQVDVGVQVLLTAVSIITSVIALYVLISTVSAQPAGAGQ